MSISFEQKNTNILNRFDSHQSGTKVKKFTFLLDGKPLSMINMDNASLSEASESIFSRWGKRASNVREG